MLTFKYNTGVSVGFIAFKLSHTTVGAPSLNKIPKMRKLKICLECGYKYPFEGMQSIQCCVHGKEAVNPEITSSRQTMLT